MFCTDNASKANKKVYHNHVTSVWHFYYNLYTLNLFALSFLRYQYSAIFMQTSAKNCISSEKGENCEVFIQKRDDDYQDIYFLHIRTTSSQIFWCLLKADPLSPFFLLIHCFDTTYYTRVTPS